MLMLHFIKIHLKMETLFQDKQSFMLIICIFQATPLLFEAGEEITVLKKQENGWWEGERNGMKGWFPAAYVKEKIIIVSLLFYKSNFNKESSGARLVEQYL